ncbi:hypothetical protein ALC57_13694 [Trachymyrmex cornetzi]|uniref:Uncharacterized protein n=1 Tax=Trachymyrmex cornetzi TaxID=471704 RepID=A0A195DMI5_9HYME|nr:hypothetical protein ALC57_13694 [Trachymyrmex cornetzi]
MKNRNGSRSDDPAKQVGREKISTSESHRSLCQLKLDKRKTRRSFIIEPLEFSLLPEIFPAQKEKSLFKRRKSPFPMIRVPKCLGPAMIDSSLVSAWVEG